MCGITAYVGEVRQEGVEIVDELAARLNHRGPDDAGCHATPGAVVAHRRLSIVDLAGGGQPLLNEDGSLALVCNGEIYNHAALRSRLGRCHTFETGSDSEVILHLYEEMGPACVSELKGMFAFVLTDGEHVLAARDPLGIKPLYLGRDAAGGLWFASEMKALPSRCTSVREFPPGTQYTDTGGFRRYFDPGWIRAGGVHETLDLDGVAKSLDAAVSRRLMADVPVGVFLSGGLDSSLVAALARPQVDELHSFSVGLEGAPDLEAARFVADRLGTEHHERVYSETEAVEVLEKVIYHLESYDPALIRSAIPCYFVSELAADHVKVVLSGEGADEAFAGYRYFGDVENPETLQRESIRILNGLHNLNLQRVDRMTMAHALEGRVPFLDTEFLDVAMSIDPAEKLHSEGQAEKWLLRQAFDGLLPDSILWRTKQEFAQGCGSEWALRAHCEQVVADTDLKEADEVFPEDTPATKEALHYRRIFEEFFPDEGHRRTVGRWRGAAVDSDANHA